MSITNGKKKVYYLVLYEKMSMFCYVSGYMGHTHLEHVNKKNNPDSIEWGEWMLALRPGTQDKGGWVVPTPSVEAKRKAVAVADVV